MRIIGGRHRGRKISCPTGNHTRPSTDRIKENLFNILMGIDLNLFEGKSILDLFSGTGALGLEALSRVAASCVFVENFTPAINSIKDNIKALGFTENTTILKQDASICDRLLKDIDHKFDIIFADPPYGKYDVPSIFNNLTDARLVEDGALFILEESKVIDISFPHGFNLLKKNDYGVTSIYISRFIGKGR